MKVESEDVPMFMCPGCGFEWVDSIPFHGFCGECYEKQFVRFT